MKKLTALFAVSLLLACSKPETNDSEIKAGGNRVGEFKGYYAIEETVRTRVVAVARRPDFYLRSYLSESDQSGSFTGLAPLLGAFGGQGISNEFQNGQPNAVNMLIWKVLLSSFAERLGNSCPGGTFPNLTYDMSSVFKESIKAVCAWPAPEAKTPQALRSLWIALMGFDAPSAEYKAFESYFLSDASPYATTAAVPTVKAMVKAITLNPYFLLEH